MWWLDYSILNTNNIKFKYYYFSNIFYIKLINFFFFFLINKKNLNSMLFSNLDAVIVDNCSYNIGIQTFFYDLQIFVNINIIEKLSSLSKLYSGNTWIERELKENNEILFKNLTDNRKLLSNYNYSKDLEYNQFNSLISDIKIIHMLFWLNFFIVCTLITLLLLNVFLVNLMSTILNIEFITVLIFFIFIFNGSIFNLNWIFGFSFIILILGGLEVALSFLILNL